MTDAGPTQKNPDAYRTISEVAADLKLPQHVLRFWETRFTQIKPLKRAGGRRFYRPEDVELLRAVKTLLYGDGYTIKGVQRILREQGPRAVAALAAAPVRRGAGPPSRSPADDETAASPIPAECRIPAPDPSRLPPMVDEALSAAQRLLVVLAELDECGRMLAEARLSSS